MFCLVDVSLNFYPFLLQSFPFRSWIQSFCFGDQTLSRSLRSSQAMPSRTLSGLKMEQRQTQCSFQRVPRPWSQHEACSTLKTQRLDSRDQLTSNFKAEGHFKYVVKDLKIRENNTQNQE